VRCVASIVPTLRSFVAGEWIGGGNLVDDLNPARPDEVVARAAHADSSLALSAVAAAAEAAPQWRRTTAPARGAILHRAAQLLEERATEIGRDIAREEGKTAAEGMGETLRASAIFRYYAGQTLEPDGETYPSHSAATFLYARREPVGVVTVITPWNFPIAIPAWKIAPALAYGNTVCWKPAEIVSLTSVRLAEVLLEAGLPAGVLNLLLGRGAEIGAALTASPEVAAVSFTGSNAVGRSIQRAAAENGIKVQLELGGKNPAVVLADADLDHAAEQLARGAFLSAGQKCTATSRVFVEQPAFDELVERFSERASNWRLGDPLDPETRVGPVASQAQFDTINGYLDLARAEGSFAAGGGAAENDGGWYIQPSVVTGLARTSRVMTEEVFGPVAAVTPVDNLEQAIHEANDTPFGLTAALFTSNLHRAFRFADEVRAGVVKINQESAGLEFHVPFGGTKASSSGSREQGRAAREFFTEWKTVYIDSMA
jgi:acyl-CoA reductase-like NAD-dependent aldehyde dehydrogenase